MKSRGSIVAAVLSAALLFANMPLAAMPRLQKKGTATQLIVEGRPFLMLGVETTNKLLEDPSDLPHLDENLAMYRKAGVNTVLVPVAWYSFEPKENEYDYTMIDALIQGCKRHDLRLIVLWFGAIKNGGLHFAPEWFKNDRQRFFRALKPDGSETYAVSPFCQAAIEADKEAFVLLMRRIRERNADSTVIMVQPENETGCQQIDNDRDHSEAATRVWNSPVPAGLMEHLDGLGRRLDPWLSKVWEAHGRKMEGTWPEVFGAAPDGQKIFMSYYIARFVEQVAAAGHEACPLPMFANDWLGSLQNPGGPIGGPDFQVLDIWQYAAPTIDIFAPDIYKSEFKEWCKAFHRPDNPLLIPEARGAQGRSAAQCWYALFQHDGMLYAPYLYIGDEYHPDHAQSQPYFERNHLVMSYPRIAQMSGLILEKQGRLPREMIAFLLDENEKAEKVFQNALGEYVFLARAKTPFPDEDAETQMVTPFAVVVQMEEDEFVAIGTKMTLEVRGPLGEDVNVVAAEKGIFRNSIWHPEAGAKLGDGGRFVQYSFPTEPLAIEAVRFRLTKVK